MARRAPDLMSGLVTLGEALVAFVANESGALADAITFRSHVVGAELNAAIGAARLGTPAAFIGRVGDDGFGTAILRRLRAEGVDTSQVTVEPGAPTGILIRERRVLGPPEVNYYRRDSAGSHLGPTDVDAAAPLIESAQWLHLSGITPALSESAGRALRRAIEVARSLPPGRQPVISLDLNLRRKLWSDAEASLVLRSLVPAVDVVFSGIDEAQTVIGPPGCVGADPVAIGRALVGLGAREAIVKRGPQGALYFSAESGVIDRVGLRLEQVVDPVGAGDGFCAGYIAARLEGLDIDAALGWAVACGAAVAAADGDTAGFPTRGELRRLLLDGPDTVR